MQFEIDGTFAHRFADAQQARIEKLEAKNRAQKEEIMTLKSKNKALKKSFKDSKKESVDDYLDHESTEEAEDK